MDAEVPWRQQAYVKVERALTLPLLILSLAMIPVLVLPVVIHLSPGWIQTLDDLDYMIWGAFALEYVLMLALAASRWHYIKTHVPDLLLVTLPMLRPLRIFRSTRALRLLRVARLSTVATQGVRLSRQRLASKGPTYALGIAVVLMLAAAALELDAERTKGNIRNFGDAIWWAMTTVTTVGYGDHYPVTVQGRVIAGVLMLVGVAVLGIVTASLAAWLVKVNTDTSETADQLSEHEQVLSRLHDLETLVLDLRSELRTARLPASGDGPLPVGSSADGAAR